MQLFLSCPQHSFIECSFLQKRFAIVFSKRGVLAPSSGHKDLIQCGPATLRSARACSACAMRRKALCVNTCILQDRLGPPAESILRGSMHWLLISKKYCADISTGRRGTFQIFCHIRKYAKSTIRWIAT